MKLRNPILMSMFAAILATGCEPQNTASGEDEFLDSVGEALFAVEDDQFALEAEGDNEQIGEQKDGLCARLVDHKMGPPPDPPAGGAPMDGVEMADEDADVTATRGKKGKKGKKGKRAHKKKSMLKKKRMALLKIAYDFDGDGELSEDEKMTLRDDIAAGCEARHARILDEFDTDGDGEISEEERAAIQAVKAAKKEARQALFAEKKADLIEAFDEDGDGELNEDERARAKEAHKEKCQARIDEFKAGFDTNEDGELDQEETDTLVAYVLTQVQNAEPIIAKDVD